MLLPITARNKGNNNTGTTNVQAKRNLVRKVAIVDSQTCFWEFFLSDSWEIWIPSASERESAIAMVKIPAITTDFISLPAANPTSNPSVVITPDVIPKFIPIFRDVFIENNQNLNMIF